MTDNNPFANMRNMGKDANPDDMLAKLNEMQQEAEETLRKYEELQEQVGASTTEAVSEDGYIKVVLNSDGNVTDIDIEDSAMRHGTRLGGMIKKTVDEATATYALKMAEMAQELVGDMDLMGMVSEHMPGDVRDRARDNVNRRD